MINFYDFLIFFTNVLWQVNIEKSVFDYFRFILSALSHHDLNLCQCIKEISLDSGHAKCSLIIIVPKSERFHFAVNSNENFRQATL